MLSELQYVGKPTEFCHEALSQREIRLTAFLGLLKVHNRSDVSQIRVVVCVCVLREFCCVQDWFGTKK